MCHECCVLLVEDDTELREILCQRLARQGAQVTAVARPAEAVAAVGQLPFHVALVDYTLPDEGGLELMVRLKRLRAELPVIVMSGIADAEVVHQARAQGAFDYLVKPFSLSLLEATIRRAWSGDVEYACGLGLNVAGPAVE